MAIGALLTSITRCRPQIEFVGRPSLRRRSLKRRSRGRRLRPERTAPYAPGRMSARHGLPHNEAIPLKFVDRAEHDIPAEECQPALQPCDRGAPWPSIAAADYCGEDHQPPERAGIVRSQVGVSHSIVAPSVPSRRRRPFSDFYFRKRGCLMGAAQAIGGMGETPPADLPQPPASKINVLADTHRTSRKDIPQDFLQVKSMT
jgi:hypothetical protein